MRCVDLCLEKGDAYGCADDHETNIIAIQVPCMLSSILPQVMPTEELQVCNYHNY